MTNLSHVFPSRSIHRDFALTQCKQAFPYGAGAPAMLGYFGCGFDLHNKHDEFWWNRNPNTGCS
jgi:hypothetical protein